MKLSLLTKALLLSALLPASVAFAQLAPPFAGGDGVETKPSFVRCMSHDTLSKIWENKGMHVIATSVAKSEEGTEVIKAVAANANQDIMIVNIFDNDKTCVLDIIEGAFINKEFWLNKPIPPAKMESS